jgi:hypothetical protein
VYVRVKSALSSWSDFLVAIAAVDRPAAGRRERHLRVFAALGACGGKHLACGPVATATTAVPLCFLGLPARGTALGLIGIALGPVELLFLSREAEISPAIGTLERFLLKTHWMTSFFYI